MQRASYANQARVHNGYHYPRSVVTAFRSRINYARFHSEFPECIDQSFAKVYAIARRFSKVTSEQFRRLAVRIGAPIRPADQPTRRLFDADFVEDMFSTEEWAFDSVALRRQMTERVTQRGVDICLDMQIKRMNPLNHIDQPTNVFRTNMSPSRVAGMEPTRRLDVFVSVVATFDNQGDGVRGFLSDLLLVLEDNFANFEVVLVDDGAGHDTAYFGTSFTC
jgi:hypothetical protein